jgi:PAS domain S-box-containing protein
VPATVRRGHASRQRRGAGVGSGWPGLFWTAFKRSRNGMALFDDDRRYVEVNAAFASMLGTRRATLVGERAGDRVIGGPLMTPSEWRAALAKDEFSGVAELRRDDGDTLTVQFAGHPETVTGRRYVLAVALGHAATRPRRRKRPRRSGTLTGREREVVRLIAAGKDGPEIAQELQIAHNTVRVHVANAMDKLSAHSRAQLVAKALAEGHLAL